jgi:hypothetical protein
MKSNTVAQTPWVDVPAQVVPAPALQSFLAFNATPKHFSLSAILSSALTGVAATVSAALMARAIEAAVVV